MAALISIGGVWLKVGASMSLSLVARQEGLTASLLFTWRRLEREGALVAAQIARHQTELKHSQALNAKLMTPMPT